MIEAETPTLWEIRRQLGHAPTIAILVKAFIHAAKLVNLDKNLTTEQIGEAANDILTSYGYLKVEEVKFLLKRALRTKDVYGRLDYNILMKWVEKYDTERTEEAMRISDQQESQEVNEPKPRPDAVSYGAYLANLRERAKADKEAAALLDSIDNAPKTPTKEEQAKKDHEFKKWCIFNYLSNKNK